jgi:hypothetical protein
MRIHRRKFLYGAGGAVVALPFLESVVFTDQPARASTDRRVYSVFVRQGNGVQQGGVGSEPDRFWPTERGALTPDIMRTRDADRAVSELAEYANKLLIVSGTRFGFDGAGCGHSGGINQCLTAAPVTGEGAGSLAGGESIDWRISQECNPPGVEPLNLMSGPQSAYIAHGLSYSGSRALRGAESNPLSVYMDMVGLGGMDSEIANEVALRRRSVNDLVRAEVQELQGSPQLGAADKARLETHFDAIRDMELTMSCELMDGEVDAMRTVGGAAEQNDNRTRVAELHMNLIALAFACDLNRVATLQIGTGNDQTRFYVDGALQNTFHRISHRVDSDGSDGPVIPNADMLHHKIDRQFGQMFKHLLDRLSMYGGSSGETLLDDCIAVWTNDLANGPPHSYRNVPQIIAGSGGGFLRQGQYVDSGNVTHNKLFNTILSAHGLTNSAGDHYDSFGDPSLEGGVIPAMIA